MLAYFEDWEAGHSPVTTGRARWLPAPFLHGMHAARSLIAEQKRKRLDDTRPKVLPKTAGVVGDRRRLG